MLEKHVHASHPHDVMRVEQIHGHRRNVIGMIRRYLVCIECIDIARPLHAAERAVHARRSR